MIKTEFDYSTQEIKDFFRFHLLTKDKVRFIYYISSVLMAIIGFLFVFVFENIALGFLLIIIAIILVLSFPYQVKRIIKKKVYSHYKRPKEIINFLDEGIIQHKDGHQYKFSWEQIIEVCETKKYLYLYISSHSAIIVTKSKLSKGKYEELIALIKNHINKITYYVRK